MKHKNKIIIITLFSVAILPLFVYTTQSGTIHI